MPLSQRIAVTTVTRRNCVGAYSDPLIADARESTMVVERLAESDTLHATLAEGLLG